MKNNNRRFEATFFRRERDGGFTVSTVGQPGDYLTATTNREELLDNPAMAERIYGKIVDGVKDKANNIIT